MEGEYSDSKFGPLIVRVLLIHRDTINSPKSSHGVRRDENSDAGRCRRKGIDPKTLGRPRRPTSCWPGPYCSPFSRGTAANTHSSTQGHTHTHNSNAPNTVWEVESSLLTRIHPTSPPCCQLAARLLCVLLIKFSSRHSWSRLSASNSAARQQMSNRRKRHSLSSEQSMHTLMQKSNQT